MRFVLDARTGTDHFPGIGRYVVNLARAIIPFLGRNDTLILLRDPTRPSFWDLKTLAAERVQVVDVPLSPFSLRQQLVIPRLLRRLKADLYHSPYYLMPYRPGTPTLVTLYDMIPLLFPRHVSIQARLLFRFATSLALRTAAHTIVISEATRRDLLAFFRLPSQKVTSILLAADSHFCPQSPARMERARRAYGLQHDYVLYLGSNKPHKNLVRLIQAFSHIRSRTPQAYLVIAGAWDSRYPEARQHAEGLGLGDAIRFLGPIPERDLPAIQTGATLFAFPSLYEGFGISVLEAMACGAPVACSDLSSLKEIGGDAVLYFNPTDVEAIAEVVGRALASPDLLADLRRRGLDRSRQFSWENTARETLTLYRDTLK